MHYLKCRRYPDGKFVSLWLCRRWPDAGDEAFLWGEVLPSRVDEIAKATGLKVEYEDNPIPNETPLAPSGHIPTTQQKELFG